MTNLDKYRRYNAKRAADPAYMAARRERDRARYIRNKADPDYKARIAETARRMREKHPEKASARLAVRNALRRGELLRGPCEDCGDPTSEAHHDDYSKPLSVRWLCRDHHVQHHLRATTPGKPSSASEGVGHD